MKMILVLLMLVPLRALADNAVNPEPATSGVATHASDGTALQNTTPCHCGEGPDHTLGGRGVTPPPGTVTPTGPGSAPSKSATGSDVK